MNIEKYRGMFLSETGEHLNSMSRLLIALEEDPSARESIDALFRSAHSIKGMAASMGYARTTELAHHLEDLLDDYRRHGTVPPGAVDRLLAGTDLLEGLLEDLAAGHPEREIDAFLVEPGNIPPALPVLPLEEGPPVEACGSPPPENGNAPFRNLRITIDLHAAAIAPAARALLVLRELAGVGTVLSSDPAEESIRGLKRVFRLTLLLQTGETALRIKDRLAEMADLDRVVVREEVEPEIPFLFRREDGQRTVRVRTELLDRFINLTGGLLTNRYTLQASCRDERWQDVREGLDQLTRLVSDLHHHVLQARMTPLESITGRFPRLIRDLCRRSGKVVAFRLEGGEVELDRAIVEALADPLMHMLRNAVDHGIEKAGEIRVKAWRDNDLVRLEVVDNGRGIDAGTIRRRAVEKGHITALQARTLRDLDVLQLICRPGFTTAEHVTDTSGRGVGMDVVKIAVENLGGTLEISSVLGKGTRFLLSVPVSAAIIQILLVEVDGRTLGIPITKVLRTIEVTRDEIRAMGRQLTIALEEETREGERIRIAVPLLSLRKILRLPTRSRPGTVAVVLIKARRRKVGLVVDRFVGQREVFVKSLGFPLDRLAGVSGATVLGDGRVIFIIDPQSFLEHPDGAGALPAGGTA